MAHLVLNTCYHADLHDGTDAVGCRKICPKVKVLMGLKMLADLLIIFKWALQLASIVLKSMQCISERELLCSKFNRVMNRRDTHCVREFHLNKHDIDGMLESLDCIHVGWKYCPVAWQGAFQGKEGVPTIVLEAVADYILWIWHASLGYTGSINDINIWDQSLFLKMLVDGTFTAKFDFAFEIGSNVFSQCWFLVDGIYPELACFAKAVDEPIGHGKKV
jgi:Plant transposon protein